MLNKWEQYIIYGGEMPRMDLPVVKEPEIQKDYNLMEDETYEPKPAIKST